MLRGGGGNLAPEPKTACVRISTAMFLSSFFLTKAPLSSLVWQVNNQVWEVRGFFYPYLKHYFLE